MAPALPSRVREILNAIRGVQTTLETNAVKLVQERSDMEKQFETITSKKRKVVTFAKVAMTSSNYNFPTQLQPMNGTSWSLSNFRSKTPSNMMATLTIRSPGSPAVVDQWTVSYEYDGTNVLTLTTASPSEDENGLIKRATVGAVTWDQIKATGASQTTSDTDTATSGSGRRRRGRWRRNV